MYKYSQRLSWNFSSNRLTRDTRARRARGEPIIDLTNSNPTVLFDSYPHLEIARALGGIASFEYEPDPLGNELARASVCEYYNSRDIEISPDRLILTASTSEAYALLFKLFCDAGDEILVPTPSYPLFEYLARLESVLVQSYRLHFDGNWYVDFDYLRRQITSRTRAIVVVNPNNPAGSFLKRNEFETLAEISSAHRIPIISDEVFMDFTFGGTPERVLSLIGRDAVLSFSLNGLSKSAGMPQMKAGWIAINGPHADREHARERLELIADTYLSVSTPVQKALSRLFEIGRDIQTAISERIRVNLATLERVLKNSPAHPLHCEGGWSAVVRLPATQPEETWCLRLLNEYGTLVQPGYFFDMLSEPNIVVSLISVPEDFSRGIARVHELSTNS